MTHTTAPHDVPRWVRTVAIVFIVIVVFIALLGLIHPMAWSPMGKHQHQQVETATPAKWSSATR